MTDTTSPPHGTYVVREDPEVRRRLFRAMTLWAWGDWVWHGIRWGATLAIVVFFTFLVSGLSTQENGRAVFAGLGIAFGIGFLWVMVSFLGRVRGQEEPPQEWTCQVTDAYWSFETVQGQRTEIPWKMMRVTFVHPEGWLIEYGRQSVLVYRAPLREAGLEDEFYSRIPAKPGG